MVVERAAVRVVRVPRRVPGRGSTALPAVRRRGHRQPGAVLAIATGLVAAGYIGLVVVLGGTVGDRADGGFWLSLLATVLVALAFQPARRSVVRLADRLAYGDRAAPYEALADFSRRIGRSPATSHLLPTIAAAAGEAVRADRVVVRVDGEGGAQLTATWPWGLPAPSATFDPTDGGRGRPGPGRVRRPRLDQPQAAAGTRRATRRAPAALRHRRAGGAGPPQRPAAARARRQGPAAGRAHAPAGRLANPHHRGGRHGATAAGGGDRTSGDPRHGAPP